MGDLGAAGAAGLLEPTLEALDPAAAVLSGKVELEPGSSVALVVSGGNVAPETAAAILAAQ